MKNPGYHLFMLIPSDEELVIGSKLANRYELLSIIGRGSVGIVYKARHELIGRMVAIKMLRSQFITDERSRKRFLREAKTASRMDHPHIISVHDFGFTDKQQPYLVMDYAKGVSLLEVLKVEKQLSAERAIHIVLQVCDAMYHAHEQGVIHRDIKPGNIMLVHKDSDNDYVMVVDLGVAKIATGEEAELEAITKTGEVCGSPFYLSPEQCRNFPLDARSDIYSLGVVLYEMLTGIPPIAGPTSYDTIAMHVNALPKTMSSVCPDREFSPRLEAVVLKTLEKDPEKRQQTMLELKIELIDTLKSLAKAEPHILPPSPIKKISPLNIDVAKTNETKAKIKKETSPIVIAIISAIAAGLSAATANWFFANYRMPIKDIPTKQDVPVKIDEKIIKKELPEENNFENNIPEKTAPEKNVDSNIGQQIPEAKKNDIKTSSNTVVQKNVNTVSSVSPSKLQPDNAQHFLDFLQQNSRDKNTIQNNIPNTTLKKLTKPEVQPIVESHGKISSNVEPRPAQDEKNINIYQSRIFNNEGVNALKGNDFDVAINKFLMAIKADPNYQLARINLGRAYFNKAIGMENSGQIAQAHKLSKQALNFMRSADASEADLQRIQNHIDYLEQKNNGEKE
jgi:serine/threonine protein kinase